MDKNKIIEAATKLVAKGAYDKAVKEYQKILDVDPKDVRVLQKMGELYQKKSDNAQAAQYFTRVAESYTSDGFFLKAIAIYKQVLKLDPSLIEINVKMAELHQQLQLLGEAMAFYQVVANHYDKQGDSRKSLEILRKMVDLDPDNVPSRVKLADLYAKQNLNAEAITEFKKAAEHLKRNGRVDDYLRVAERLSTLQPDNLQLARELAEAYLQRKDEKRALAKLQVCFKADSRDIDTLRLLAVAFQGLGQTSKTLSVYKELARAYADKGFRDDADQTWRQVARLDPADPDAQAWLNPGGVAPPPPPAPQAAPPAPPPQAAPPARPQAPAFTGAQQAYAPPPAPAQRPKVDTNVAKLLTETDVYVKYGLHDKALEHLRKIFAVDPENIDAHEKAYAIYVAANNQGPAFDQLLNVLRLHTRSGDAVRAQPYLATILQQAPGHAEVPVFLATLRVSGGPAMQAATVTNEPDEAILVDSHEDDVIVADEPEDVLSAEIEVPADEPLESAEVLTGEELELGPVVPTSSESDLGPPPVPDDHEEPMVVAGVEEEPAYQPPAEFGYDEALYDAPDGEPQTGKFTSGEEATGQFSALHPDDTAAPLPEREPVGLGDDVHEVPTGVTARLHDEASPAWAPAAATMDEEPALAPAPVEEAVEAPPEDEAAGEECDEATFFLEQGLFDEAREILETVLIAYPEHRRATELLARLEAEAAGAAAGSDGGERDAFDLAAELANELGDLGQEAEASAEPAGGGDEYQVSVEEVFAEFKKGLEKVVKPEDVDTHYDLGVAYKEMGLMDDAIGEFSIARKGCLGAKKEVDCLSMMALLQMMKGDFEGAVDSFGQALLSEHAVGETEKSLRYDLASAYEGAGQHGRALGQFLKVQALDGGYREVAANVQRLSAIAVPEDDAPPPRPPAGARSGGGRKVGYV